MHVSAEAVNPRYLLGEWEKPVFDLPGEWGAHREDFRAMATQLPTVFRKAAAFKYVQQFKKTNHWRNSVYAANRVIQPIVERQKNRGYLTDDKAIKTKAKNRAKECELQKSGMSTASPENVYRALSISCTLEGISAPDIERFSVQSAVARLCCERWWTRNLRRFHARGFEATARDLNIVCSKRQIYCSNHAAARVRTRNAENWRVLEQIEAVCEDTGEAMRLSEIAAHWLANPEIRRGELMTRIRGFEEYATKYGDAGLFVTLTCPPRFHATTKTSGRPVPKYDGSTPRDGQDYLINVWARIRAEFNRRKINVYGFRVAEPHHDGCPHHHYLLFCADGHSDAVRSIFSKKRLTGSGELRQSVPAKVRAAAIKVVDIDPRKGTAAGYIAKYIAKSIDGFGIDHDLFGTDARSAAERVIAWSRTWGIRQFQQFGGPRVGLWRELRRQRETVEGAPEQLENARLAADAGLWARFCELAPGLEFVKRPIDRLGMYGDEIAPRVVGVVCNAFELITRPFSWVLRAVSAPWTRVNNCTGVEGGDRSRVRKKDSGSNGFSQKCADAGETSSGGIFNCEFDRGNLQIA